MQKALEKLDGELRWGKEYSYRRVKRVITSLIIIMNAIWLRKDK
jgi:hypothetical protein